MDKIANLLKATACVMQDSEVMAEYATRHGVHAAPVLTVCDDRLAAAVALSLAPRIEGKTVIEVGGGLGLLAFYLADYAKKVWCIEANPLWSATFLQMLFADKPKNLSYLFGAADEFAGTITADVALFCSHSGIASMRQAGHLFAPLVVDIYGEMIAANPDSFDSLARKLRMMV